MTAEYAFELSLCAHLEAAGEWLVGRQVGGAVRAAGRRILDVVLVEPGAAFERRAAITAATIPSAAIEADVGPGRFRYWKRAMAPLGLHSTTARRIVDRAIDIGVFEERRERGRRYIRQTARYPDWFERVVAIENKPDLAEPGRLRRQLRTDVALALADEVWVATESYVTGAHRHRLPEPVGIWRYHPDGELEVVRPAQSIAVDRPGIEIQDRHPDRTDIAAVTADEKRHARRRIAERVYGSGWRPTGLPSCGKIRVGEGGTPDCSFKKRIVRPAACGPACPGHRQADPPPYAPETWRDRRTPWIADPDGRTRRQATLDGFE